MTTPFAVTIEELNAVLNAPTVERPTIKLSQLTPDIDEDELLEIASEDDERGPLTFALASANWSLLLAGVCPHGRPAICPFSW